MKLDIILEVYKYLLYETKLIFFSENLYNLRKNQKNSIATIMMDSLIQNVRMMKHQYKNLRKM